MSGINRIESSTRAPSPKSFLSLKNMELFFVLEFEYVYRIYSIADVYTEARLNPHADSVGEKIVQSS